MKTNYTIRTMQPEELQIAIDWARQEGWNPGLYDASCFYAADPKGFFIGEQEGEIISVASEVNYDTSSSFFGLYIVKKSYRNQGYGLRMTEHCLKYAGNRNIGLDGVLENVHLYQRKGFKPFFINQRFEHLGFDTESNSSEIVTLSSLSLNDIVAYERSCFFGNRSKFIEKWITQPQVTALAYLKNNKIQGYGVCRKCYQGYKIGPLFANNEIIAESLFLALQQHKVGEKVYIDIPETNTIGNYLVKKYNLKSVFSTMRMYNQFLPDLDYSKVVGNTTFELG
jgi:GNAT superfamily N-acetyltransferase